VTGVCSLYLAYEPAQIGSTHYICIESEHNDAKERGNHLEDTVLYPRVCLSTPSNLILSQSIDTMYITFPKTYIFF